MPWPRRNRRTGANLQHPRRALGSQLRQVQLDGVGFRIKLLLNPLQRSQQRGVQPLAAGLDLLDLDGPPGLRVGFLERLDFVPVGIGSEYPLTDTDRLDRLRDQPVNVDLLGSSAQPCLA